jgi:hypothetical protein
MELKRFIPEITTIGLAEAAATAFVAKSAIEGNPMSIKETMSQFAFVSFFGGMQTAVIVYALRHLKVTREEKGFRFTLRE